MAAGQGFKTFNTGDVLTASDVNGYLMQGVWVFASAAARDAAVTSPQEGNTCYLKDTDVIQVYSGSAWVTKSGTPSPLTTKGDLYTYSTTDARLAVGTNGQALLADSTTATGLKWGSVSATKNFSSIGTGTTSSGSTVTVSGISNQDILLVVFQGIQCTAGSVDLTVRINSDSGSNYANFGIDNTVGSTYVAGNYGSIGLTGRTSISFSTMGSTSASLVNGYLMIFGGASAGIKTYNLAASADGNAASGRQRTQGGYWNNSATITSISLITAGTFSSGSFTVYGSA